MMVIWSSREMEKMSEARLIMTERNTPYALRQTQTYVDLRRLTYTHTHITHCKYAHTHECLIFYQLYVNDCNFRETQTVTWRVLPHSGRICHYIKAGLNRIDIDT